MKTILIIWLIIIAALIASLSKMIFGGLGKNPLNPALVGALFIIIFASSYIGTQGGYLNSYEVDAISGATPLSNFSYSEEYQQIIEDILKNHSRYVSSRGFNIVYYNKIIEKVKLLRENAVYCQLFRKLFLFFYVNLLPYSAFILPVLTQYFVFLVTFVNITRRNM